MKAIVPQGLKKKTQVLFQMLYILLMYENYKELPDVQSLSYLKLLY